MKLTRYLERFYRQLDELKSIRGQGIRLAECNGKLSWPNRGVYLICEPGELRKNKKEMRIVRVGTHALGANSKATLWSRLKAHRGRNNGLGNHRGSIFRKHVGYAIINRDGLEVSTWGIGSSEPYQLKLDRTLKEKEQRLEERVSLYLGKTCVYWIEISDPSGPQSDRSFVERNLIALFSGCSEPADKASSTWLGNFSQSEEIKKSSLWNVDHVYSEFDSECLEKLQYYIDKMKKAE